MSIEVDKYIGRAVIRYLNGDMDLFQYYKSIALKIYKANQEFLSIEELISKDTKDKLYQLVS